MDQRWWFSFYGGFIGAAYAKASNSSLALYGMTGMAVGHLMGWYLDSKEQAAKQQAAINATAPSGYGTTQTYFPRYTLPPIARFEPRGEGYPPGPPWGYMRNRHIPNA